MNFRFAAALVFVVVALLAAWALRRERVMQAVVLPTVAVNTLVSAAAVPDRPTPHIAALHAGDSRGRGDWHVVGSAWGDVEQPEFAAFRAWTERYLAAAPAGRAALLAEGRSLAAARRAVLAELIKSDPRSALAAAVPMAVRQELPAEIVSLLEERVSGVGDLALNAVTPAPGHPVPAETMYRATVIDGREYRAHVYGRREAQATVTSTSMVGIALDRHFAVAEAPLRIAEPGERVQAENVPTPLPTHAANDPIAPLAIEYDGRAYVVCCANHVSIIEAALLASEGDYSEADNQPGTSTVSGRPSQAWTHGTKRVLIIRVDFSDRTPLVIPDGGPVLTEDVAVNLFHDASGVDAFFAQNSFGKTALQVAAAVGGDSPDVTPVFRMPATGESYAMSGDSDLLHAQARAAAANAGFNLEDYDRIGVVFPYIGPQTTAGRNGFAGSEITYGGLANVIGKNFWVNGFYDFRIVAHELGHTYGLRHANLWKPPGTNPVSLEGDDPGTPAIDERSIEYGDPFDLMGSGNSFGNHFGQWNKSLLQWIPDSAVTVAQQSGTYRIYRFDAAGANLTSARALKIVRDSVRDYWIGYRRATDSASMDNGAYVLWGYNSNQPGHLLDLTTPGTNASDAGLAVGATFNDAVAGIAITPLAQGGSGAEEYLDIQIVLQPKIAWTSATYLASEQGGSVTLTARRTANATGAVSVSYATANDTATSPADYSAANGTLSWSDGDMADKTVTIALVPDAFIEGVETFTVTLSNITGGVLGDVATTTVTIADPGVRDLSFGSDFINSTVRRVIALPDGSAVLAGWFTSAQNDAFQSFTRHGVLKVDAEGNLDTAFADGAGAGAGTFMRDLAVQPDGKIIVLGNFTSFHGSAAPGIVRLNSDGSLDTTFNLGSGPNGSVNTALVQPDGKIILGGSFTSFNGAAREYLVRLHADGSVDHDWVGPDFAQTTGWRVDALALQADGKLIVGGTFYFSPGNLRSCLCRLLPTGAIDSAFNGVVQGAYDGTFIENINRIVVQPDGAIVIAGNFTTYNNTPRAGLARVTTTGALDAGFAPEPNHDVYALELLPDGRLLVGGAFTSIGGSANNRLALLATNGVADAAFAAAGGHAAGVEDFALLPDGRVLLAGDFASFQGATVQGNGRPLWRFFSGLNGTPGEIQFSSASYSGNEGDAVALTVTRSGSGIGALTVGYATRSGTAGAADFTATSGVLTWADGDLSPKTIIVPLANDAASEGVESFTVALGQPLIGGAVLGANHVATVDISDPVATGFAAFRMANFTLGEQADDAISGATADPDGDGLNNLIEYALGLAPKTVNTAGEISTVGTAAGDWVFVYTRPADRSDVSYFVEASTNLAAWSDANVTHEFVAADGAQETWRARYPMSSAAVVFFRLRVEMP